MASTRDEDPKRAGSSRTEDAQDTLELRDDVLGQLLQAGLSSPDTLGPYRLLRCIGEGGMGIVYEAEQSSPIQRRVAVKLVKEGSPDKEVLARFETERQALAVMDHPGIATVFDGGTTGSGRLYFAMELVHGEPIVEYCDRHRLTTEQRLRLFVDVCRAVGHAHQKGVIHRDLKPSNVLVQEVDGHPQPKVIDFGVAKAVGRPLTDRTLMTVQHQLLGTPAFMSPEQLDPSGLHIDTRTDVYSLGVLLYLLLTGELPFGGNDGDTSFEELRRRVLSEEPMRPSRRVHSSDGETLPTADRGSDRRLAGSQLQGDLDWITLRALEKERTRRYGSVAELAADVERHLAHEPVSAGPPDLGYRVGKFVRRHRVGVVTVSAFGLLLVVSIVAVSLALVRARRSESEARTRASETEQVAEFLIEVFDANDPYLNRGEKPTVEELLERGAERIDDRLDDHPAVRALMLSRLGRVMMNQGLHARADELLAEAQREAEQLPGREELVAEILIARAFGLTQLGRPDEALEVALQGVELIRRDFGETSRQARAAYRVLGWAQLQRGQWSDAIATFRQALEVDAELGAPEPLETADLERLLGFALHRIGDVEAEPHIRRANELYLGADPEHPYLAWVLSELGSFAANDGRLDEAVSLYGRALEIQHRILGEGHLATADILNDMGVAYWHGQRYDEAERYWLEALAVREQSLTADNPALIQSLNNVALIYESQMRLVEAERYYRRAVEIGKSAYGADSPQIGQHLSNLALVLQKQRRAAEAKPLAVRSLALQREALGETASKTLYARLAVATIQRSLGEIDAAIETLRQLEEDLDRLETKSAVLEGDVSLALVSTLTLRSPPSAVEIEDVLEDVVRTAEPAEVSAGRRRLVMRRVHGYRAVLKGREGDLAESQRLYREHLALHRDEDLSASEHYDHARMLTLLGETGPAIAELEKVRGLGFAEYPPEVDPVLVPLHTSDEYRALVAEYRKPWAGRSGVRSE